MQPTSCGDITPVRATFRRQAHGFAYLHRERVTSNDKSGTVFGNPPNPDLMNQIAEDPRRVDRRFLFLAPCFQSCTIVESLHTIPRPVPGKVQGEAVCPIPRGADDLRAILTDPLQGPSSFREKLRLAQGPYRVLFSGRQSGGAWQPEPFPRHSLSSSEESRSRRTIRHARSRGRQIRHMRACRLSAHPSPAA